MRLARFIEVRSRQPCASIYLVTDSAGRKVAGNVESVPPEVLRRSEPAPQVVPYKRIEEDEPATRHAALVQVVGLPDGSRILVGRDVIESEQLFADPRSTMDTVFAHLSLDPVPMESYETFKGQSSSAVPAEAASMIRDAVADDVSRLVGLLEQPPSWAD